MEEADAVSTPTLLTHTSPKNNLKIRIKTEPITVGDIRIQKLDIYRCIRSSRESVTCRLCFYAEIQITFGTAWVLHY